MLEGVEGEVGEAGDIRARGVDAEDAALVARSVAELEHGMARIAARTGGSGPKGVRLDVAFSAQSAEDRRRPNPPQEATLSRSVRMLIVTAALLALAPVAHAATPFTAGTGTDPSVAVGMDGTGHVVWATTEDNSKVGYCRVAAGAESCNRTEALNFAGIAAAHSTAAL